MNFWHALPCLACTLSIHALFTAMLLQNRHAAAICHGSDSTFGLATLVWFHLAIIWPCSSLLILVRVINPCPSLERGVSALVQLPFYLLGVGRVMEAVRNSMLTVARVACFSYSLAGGIPTEESCTEVGKFILWPDLLFGTKVPPNST